MKQLIISLALILSFLAPALAQEPSEFLAVYTSGDRVHRYTKQVFNHRIDALCSAKDWRSLAPFLRQVKSQAQGRKILLNLCVHGMDVCPILCVAASEKAPSYSATFGGVLNVIEEELTGANLVVITETCHGSIVWAGSLTPGPELINVKAKKCLLLPRTKGAPSFEVWGVEDYSNPIPCAMEQYLHKDFQTIHDLRTLAPVRLSKETQELCKYLNYVILRNEQAKDGATGLK